MRNPLRALFAVRSGIGDSHALLQYLLKGHESSSGVTVNEQTVFAIPTVLACVGLISRTMLTLPVDVMERLPGRKRRQAEGHPLARLFDNPNSWQDWPMFVQLLQVHLLLRGNGYAWINWTTDTRDGSEQAYELIPMHPDQVAVEQAKDYSLRYTLTRTDGTRVPLPQHEVLHLRGLSTDGVMGRSVIYDLKDVFGQTLAAQEYTGNRWKRGGVPDVALTHPKTLSDKAQRSLEDKFEETYGGKSGRRVAVLEEGMTIKEIAFTPQQHQFLETHKFTKSELASIFPVPPHMIGDTEKSTSWGTGIEQQKLGYQTFTIQPWVTIWEHGLRRALIKNPQRFYVKFRVEGLLRGDSGQRASFYERMWRMGVFTINDILALEDMDPVDGGDVRYVPMNYVPLGTPVDDQARAAGLLGELLERLRAETQLNA